MASKKIIDLTAITTLLDTDLSEVSANGAGSFKETRAQTAQNILFTGRSTSFDKVNANTVGAATQLVGPTASYYKYVSQFQFGVGSGTITDPYSDPNSAFTTYSPGFQIIKFDVGTFPLPAVIPVNVTIEGSGKEATVLSGTSLGVNQGSWSVGTNPYIIFRNLTLDFTTSAFSPTTYKTGSKLIFENCIIKTSVAFSNIETVTFINCTVITPTFSFINNIYSYNGIWSTNFTFQDGSPSNVPIINFRSDNDSFLSSANCIISFTGGVATTAVVKIVNSENKLQALTYGNTGGSGSSGFIFIFDATSYPATITSPTSSVAIITSVENWAQVLTAYPTLSANNVFTGQNSFRSPSVLNSVVTTLSGNSGTISAPQLTTGVLTFTTTANASWSLPTAAQMDSQIGGTQPVGAGMRGIEINNPNNFTLTITAGTNFTLGLMSIAGTLVIPANTSVTVGFTKTATTPSYSLYGNSNNPQGSGDVTKAGDNVFTGQNTFLGLTLSNNSAVVLTANSGTMTAGQLLFGNTEFNPTADATWTLPAGTAIDAALSGGSPGSGIGFENICLTNISGFTVTFTAGASSNFNGLSFPGVLILGPNSSVNLKLIKDASTNYIYYGSSGVRTVQAVFSLMIGNGIDLTYPMMRMPFSGKLITASTICQTGTATGTISINATPVTATPNSISTSNNTQSITGANTFSAGDYINITLSSSVTPTRVLITIQYSYNVPL